MSHNHYRLLCISKLILIKAANNLWGLWLLELRQRNEMLRWFHLIIQLLIRRVGLGSLEAEHVSMLVVRAHQSLPNTGGCLGVGYHFHKAIGVILPHFTQIDFIMSQNCGASSCLGCYKVKHLTSQKWVLSNCLVWSKCRGFSCFLPSFHKPGHHICLSTNTCDRIWRHSSLYL